MSCFALGWMYIVQLLTVKDNYTSQCYLNFKIGVFDISNIFVLYIAQKYGLSISNHDNHKDITFWREKVKSMLILWKFVGSPEDHHTSDRTMQFHKEINIAQCVHWAVR